MRGYLGARINSTAKVAPINHKSTVCNYIRFLISLLYRSYLFRLCYSLHFTDILSVLTRNFDMWIQTQSLRPSDWIFSSYQV